MQLHVKLLKNSKNDVFISKKRTKKVSRDIFRGFEVTKSVRLVS